MAQVTPPLELLACQAGGGLAAQGTPFQRGPEVVARDVKLTATIRSRASQDKRIIRSQAVELIQETPVLIVGGPTLEAVVLGHQEKPASTPLLFVSFEAAPSADGAEEELLQVDTRDGPVLFFLLLKHPLSAGMLHQVAKGLRSIVTEPTLQNQSVLLTHSLLSPLMGTAR